MSKIRQRTKNLLVAGLVGAIAMGIVASGGAIYMINQQAQDQKLLRIKYETKLKETEKLLEDQQAVMKEVVVTSKKISAGTKLTEKDLAVIQIPETKAPVNMMQTKEELIGKIVKVDVDLNTPLIYSIVYEEGVTPNDLRAHEYNIMELPTKIRKGQFVDVRISFLTGEDFIVLSKKKVNDVSETTVWYNVNESEILAMSSATVDAYLNSAKMYAIIYSDPFMQDKAIENYPVNLQVIDLIQSNPNVLVKANEQLKKSVRKKLELNLSEMDEADKMKVENGTVVLQQRATNNQLTNQPYYDTNDVPKEEIVQPNEIPNKEILDSQVMDSQAMTDSGETDVFAQPLVK